MKRLLEPRNVLAFSLSLVVSIILFNVAFRPGVPDPAVPPTRAEQVATLSPGQQKGIALMDMAQAQHDLPEQEFEELTRLVNSQSHADAEFGFGTAMLITTPGAHRDYLVDVADRTLLDYPDGRIRAQALILIYKLAPEQYLRARRVVETDLDPFVVEARQALDARRALSGQ